MDIKRSGREGNSNLYLEVGEEGGGGLDGPHVVEVGELRGRNRSRRHRSSSLWMRDGAAPSRLDLSV